MLPLPFSLVLLALLVAHGVLLYWVIIYLVRQLKLIIWAIP